MTNPVVVFFDRQTAAEEVDGWAWPDGLASLPIGWTKNNSVADPRTVEGEYELLLLDDTCAVKDQLPNSRHSNKDLNEVLLIVTHNGSEIDKNKNPSDDETLETWGKPAAIKSFSHLKGNEVFKEINEVLKDKAKAADFANKWRNHRLLEAYDFLALFCTCQQVTESDVRGPIKDFKEKINNICGEKFLLAFELVPIGVKEAWDHCKEEGSDNADWGRRYKLIEDAAEPLAE